MAGISFISAVAAAASLLVLASISGITEGRSVPMPMDGNLHRKISKTVVVVGPLIKSTPPPAFHPTPAAASDVEVQGGDFRPTTPGHSPGAGHSLAPASHVDTEIH